MTYAPSPSRQAGKVTNTYINRQMEEQIRKTVSGIRRAYVCFWLAPVIFIVCGECGGSLVGLYADNARMAYCAETLSILSTAVCVPVSLKLFAWILSRRIDRAGIAEALRLYSVWSIVRLGLLALPVWIGIGTYYTALSSTGALCAAIGLTASLFCLPGDKRLRRELHIEKDTEQEER